VGLYAEGLRSFDAEQFADDGVFGFGEEFEVAADALGLWLWVLLRFLLLLNVIIVVVCFGVLIFLHLLCDFLQLTEPQLHLLLLFLYPFSVLFLIVFRFVAAV
jgi:hypothetical protein